MNLITIKSSPNQIKETLKWMQHFQDKYRADYDWVELSRTVVRQCQAVEPEQETEAVRRWINAFVQYRQDPYGVEYLQDPMVLIQTQAGDCDDMACLAGVLLANLGHDCYPAGVVWVGEHVPTHAVCIDVSTNLVCDPVSSVPAGMWPEPPYQLGRFVTLR